MALYRAAATRIFPDRRIVCGLVWTDGPCLMRLSDALLDRQMALIRRRALTLTGGIPRYRGVGPGKVETGFPPRPRDRKSVH